PATSPRSPYTTLFRSHLQGMLYKFLICQLGNMHQPVLMDADIHKSPEVNDIAHGSLEDHALLQVFDIQHIAAQDGPGHILSGISDRKSTRLNSSHVSI